MKHHRENKMNPAESKFPTTANLKDYGVVYFIVLKRKFEDIIEDFNLQTQVGYDDFDYFIEAWAKTDDDISFCFFNYKPKTISNKIKEIQDVTSVFAPIGLRSRQSILKTLVSDLNLKSSEFDYLDPGGRTIDFMFSA